MAQMSHELRTPLNAVIGFSELMLRELHGPLGNARYQEYAHHISESGGRLLKSSEEALAVTEAMTALMADRGGAKRERRIAATLVRDAWRAATSALESAAPRLVLTTCTTCDITCERRPTVQALEHLLREALGRAAAGGAVTVTGRRQAGRRSVEIGWRGSDRQRLRSSKASRREGGSSLRIILARLLLEMQGASARLHRERRGCGWPASSSRGGDSSPRRLSHRCAGSPACWSGSSRRLWPGGRRCSRQRGKARRSSGVRLSAILT